MFFSKILLFLILLSVVLTNDGCRKQDDVVPYVRVNFTIFLSDPDFISLQTIGNSVYVTGGVSGIILYRKSQDEFSAIERCCSYHPSDRCAVLVDSLNTNVLYCKCCNSKFYIGDGSVISGVASRPLTTYQTLFDSQNNTLKVFN
ncbi:MAG: hypothetical protein ACUVQP_09180 [Bacteroidales bacterium]